MYQKPTVKVLKASLKVFRYKKSFSHISTTCLSMFNMIDIEVKEILPATVET